MKKYILSVLSLCLLSFSMIFAKPVYYLTIDNKNNHSIDLTMNLGKGANDINFTAPPGRGVFKIGNHCLQGLKLKNIDDYGRKPKEAKWDCKKQDWHVIIKKEDFGEAYIRYYPVKVEQLPDQNFILGVDSLSIKL